MSPENNPTKQSKNWKKIIEHEFFEYLFNFVFLACFLVAFAWYRRLILKQYDIENPDYWTPLIEAAILAKVIMIGDIMGVGKRLRKKSVALIALYRTFAFSLLVGVFTILEHVIGGWIHKESIMKSLGEITTSGTAALIAKCVLILTTFFPFFVYKEYEKVFGEKKVRRLLFRKQNEEDNIFPDQN